MMMIHMKPTSDQTKLKVFFSSLVVGFSREQRYFDYRFSFSTGINTTFCCRWCIVGIYTVYSILHMDYLDNAVGNGEKYTEEKCIFRVFFFCFSVPLLHRYPIRIQNRDTLH